MVHPGFEQRVDKFPTAYGDDLSYGNGATSGFSYGNGECVELFGVDPNYALARGLGLEAVGIRDTKDRDGPCLIVSLQAAKALVAYAADGRPIPGMDTESELFDPFTLRQPGMTADQRHDIWNARDVHPTMYGLDGNNPAISGWVPTRHDADDCIELGAVDPASALRLIGCTAMRYSLDPEGPIRIFSRREMAAFQAGAAAGDFDDPGAPSQNPRAALQWRSRELPDGGTEDLPLSPNFDIRHDPDQQQRYTLPPLSASAIY